MEIIVGIATVVLVFITGYYAWVTKRILEANREAVRASENAVNVMREQALL